MGDWQTICGINNTSHPHSAEVCKEPWCPTYQQFQTCLKHIHHAACLKHYHQQEGNNTKACMCLLMSLLIEKDIFLLLATKTHLNDYFKIWKYHNAMKQTDVILCVCVLKAFFSVSKYKVGTYWLPGTNIRWRNVTYLIKGGVIFLQSYKIRRKRKQLLWKIPKRLSYRKQKKKTRQYGVFISESKLYPNLNNNVMIQIRKLQMKERELHSMNLFEIFFINTQIELSSQI